MKVWPFHRARPLRVPTHRPPWGSVGRQDIARGQAFFHPKRFEAGAVIPEQPRLSARPDEPLAVLHQLPDRQVGEALIRVVGPEGRAARRYRLRRLDGWKSRASHPGEEDRKPHIAELRGHGLLGGWPLLGINKSKKNKR